MNNIIGKNIYSFRKKQGLTQDELAGLVNVSFQAVSKWENGNSLPDISTLPLLANVLHCNIDALLGYAAEQAAEQQKILTLNFSSKLVIINEQANFEFIH